MNTAVAKPKRQKRTPAQQQLFDLLTPKERRKRHDPVEEKIQVKIVKTLRALLPEHRVYHNANGGRRSKREGFRFKLAGVLAGVFDLTIIGPGQFIAYIEVKRPGEKIINKSAQDEFKSDLIYFGIPYAVVHDEDEAITAIRQWGLI